MLSFKMPAYYRSPMTQVVIVGITCFATVGMYSALSNLGAGGTHDIALSDISNAVLYAAFALTGLIGGGVTNMLGQRMALFLGTIGYAIYVGALWCFQSRGTRWFVIFGGAMLGVSAGLLWSAQGCIIMSYPPERDRGKAFGVFWAIFQSGTLLGSIVALAINIRSGGLSSVSTSTYIAFLIIIFVGMASAFLILPPNKVVRRDGSVVKVDTSTRLRDELKGMIRVCKDWRLLALAPMFFASNFYYSYLGALNASVFDGPTRAMNATLGGVGEIVGSILIGWIYDVKWLRRRHRGYLGLGVVAGSTIALWAVCLSWQVNFGRDYRETHGGFINYHDANYKGKAALFFFYYFWDACYQAFAYWTTGSLSDDPFTIARITGVFKAVQSVGAAGAYGMDAKLTPLLNEHLASWSLCLISFVPAFFVIRVIKSAEVEDQETTFVKDAKEDDAIVTAAPPKD